MSDTMDTQQFDKAVVAAVFAEAAVVGWRRASLVQAARNAGLDLARLRIRFPGKRAVLLRFGTAVDQAVLAAAPMAGSARDRVFDLLMARFDQLQAHRAGLLALMRDLPGEPGTAAIIYGANLRSMRWMLEAAGVPASGVLGALRVHGLAACWAYALRAWEKDKGTDLAATMAALDRALDRAMQAEESIPGRREPTEGSDVPAPGGPATAPPLIPGAAVDAAEDGPAVI